MNYLKRNLQTTPFFLFLLPVFFVLHVVTENYKAGIGKEALWLCILYLAIAGAFSFLFWLLFRNFRKASLLAFVIIAFNFFFGSTHDFLKKTLGSTPFARYSFVIPATMVLLIVLAIYLKKTKRDLFRATLFLNCLLCLLVLIDAAVLVQFWLHPKVHRVSIPGALRACADCSRPDVYLIVADEYAGKDELHDLFGFDNSAFENALKARGFHMVQHSKANYNATVYSISSMLDMNYIQNLQAARINQPDMFVCRKIINSNHVLSFFKQNGYTVENFTFFDLDDKRKVVTNPFFVNKKELFTDQTLPGRIRRDLGYYFASPKKREQVIKQHFFNNRIIDRLTKNAVLTKSPAPRFVYTHFAMPHHPYYTDSNGKEFPVQRMGADFPLDKKAYIEYMIYTNKKLLELVDHIKNNSPQPPVIVLMSDHGFRQFKEPVDKKYHFMTLNAIHLPNQDYSLFYDGMSNVNQFRIILNTQFGQRLPLLKDSTIFLSE